MQGQIDKLLKHNGTLAIKLSVEFFDLRLLNLSLPPPYQQDPGTITKNKIIQLSRFYLTWEKNKIESPMGKDYSKRGNRAHTFDGFVTFFFLFFFNPNTAGAKKLDLSCRYDRHSKQKEDDATHFASPLVFLLCHHSLTSLLSIHPTLLRKEKRSLYFGFLLYKALYCDPDSCKRLKRQPPFFFFFFFPITLSAAT